MDKDWEDLCDRNKGITGANIATSHTCLNQVITLRCAVPRPQTRLPVFGLMVGVPEPLVDMDTEIVQPPPTSR